MQPVIGWKSLPLDRALKSWSCSSERLKVRLIALGCVAVAHFIAVSSASAQDYLTYAYLLLGRDAEAAW